MASLLIQKAKATQNTRSLSNKHTNIGQNNENNFKKRDYEQPECTDSR
uniref:Uncharacterized protein n=1 Tax=Rhizophora mucronata TaxID=61149 RepID=A0A2P2P4R2_RHIMU